MELSCLQNNLFTQYTEYSKQILPHESYAQLYYNCLFARFKTTWHMKELLNGHVKEIFIDNEEVGPLTHINCLTM